MISLLHNAAIAAMHLLELGVLFALASSAIKASSLWLALCERYGCVRYVTDIGLLLLAFAVICHYQIDLFETALGGAVNSTFKGQLPWLGYILSTLALVGAAGTLSRILIFLKLRDGRPREIREYEARFPSRK